MVLTLDTIRNITSNISKMLVTDTTSGGQKEELTSFVNQAQDEVGQYYTWWFLERRFKVTLTAALSFVFPTADEDSAAVVLDSIDLSSVRVASGPLTFAESSVLDVRNPTWTSDGATGTPYLFALIGRKFYLEKTPDATWLTANPYLYFRGWKMFTELSADGEVSEIPANWCRVLLPGTLYMAQKRQGDTEWPNTRTEFYSMLKEMRERCRPGRGQPMKVQAPRIFRLAGRRSVNVGL